MHSNTLQFRIRVVTIAVHRPGVGKIKTREGGLALHNSIRLLGAATGGSVGGVVAIADSTVRIHTNNSAGKATAIRGFLIFQTVAIVNGTKVRRSDNAAGVFSVRSAHTIAIANACIGGATDNTSNDTTTGHPSDIITPLDFTILLIANDAAHIIFTCGTGNRNIARVITALDRARLAITGNCSAVATINSVKYIDFSVQHT